MTQQIQLSQGKVALIDDIDLDRIGSYKWCANRRPNGGYYAVRHIGSRIFRKRVYMHREIMGAPEGAEVDHIDLNTLNNRRSNLRLCTTVDNGRNRTKNRNNTSGYKGVTWHKGHNRWMAQLGIDNRQIFLGYFDSPEDAARIYDEKAKELYGAFANLNFKEPL